MTAERLFFSSRGDLVRCRVAGVSPGEPRPLVLLCGPDGASDGAWVDARLERFGRFAVVAALDLPLCGGRSSDKLSDLVFGPSSELGARLAPDLEQQVRHDLERAIEKLVERGAVDADRVALCGAGLGAHLVRGVAESGRRPWCAALLEDDDPALAERLLRERLGLA
jgi:hypothetical protein